MYLSICFCNTKNAFLQRTANDNALPWIRNGCLRLINVFRPSLNTEVVHLKFISCIAFHSINHSKSFAFRKKLLDKTGLYDVLLAFIVKLGDILPSFKKIDAHDSNVHYYHPLERQQMHTRKGADMDEMHILAKLIKMLEFCIADELQTPVEHYVEFHKR